MRSWLWKRCYLFRVEQGDTRYGGPGVFMRHQFVSLESVHTIRVQYTALIQLVLLGLPCSYKHTGTYKEQGEYVSVYTVRPNCI